MGVGAVVRGGKNQYQDPDAYVPTGAGESGMGSRRAAGRILARVKVLRATLSWGRKFSRSCAHVQSVRLS